MIKQSIKPTDHTLRVFEKFASTYRIGILIIEQSTLNRKLYAIKMVQSEKMAIILIYRTSSTYFFFLLFTNKMFPVRFNRFKTNFVR